MSAMLAIAGADVAERTRRFAFLLTIAAALYAGYVYIPDVHAGYSTVVIQAHRGLYTSAYVAVAATLLSNMFISLVGFFLIRGAVERDRELKVDGLVCASPVKRMTFIAGKFLSNLAVLLTIGALSLVAAMVMQELRGESRHIDVLAYALPYLGYTLPLSALVSALAIAFDVVAFLRGAFGSVVYFLVVWTNMATLPVAQSGGMTRAVAFDPLGTTQMLAALVSSYHHAFPLQKITDVEVGGSPVPHSGIAAFVFGGLTWTPQIVMERLALCAAAVLILITFAVHFDRFRRDNAGGRAYRVAFDAARIIPNIAALRLFRAEFALLLNGAGFWWLLGAVGIAIATGVAPLGTSAQYILPIALIWPLERLSALGSREQTWHTHEILACAGRYAQRATVAQWCAGTLLGALLCSGFLLHALAAGHGAAAFAALMAVAAIAAVALVFGTITGVSRVFEAVYLLLWYIGPVEKLPLLDFSGATLQAPVMLSVIAASVIAPAILLTMYRRALV